MQVIIAVPIICPRFSVTHSCSVTPVNIAINNIPLKTGCFAWATFFNHFYVIRPTKFHEITEPIGLLRHSRSFKVTDFGTNRKPIYDFLFPRYSLGKVQNRYILLPLFGSTPRRRGYPGTISVKFLHKVHRWPFYQMA